MGGQTKQDPRIGSTLADYRIERLIGRGGMSVVYLAEQIRLKRRAALKLLAPELADDARFRERFLRESELAASLDHPNVIPIFDAGETDGILYIAMRYVEGQDLRQLIQQEGKLAPEQALRILRPVADALDYAHAHGLVHRDVKPGNILLATDGPVYLSDFGLTRRVDEGASLTEAGELVGSIDYAAPEQIDGRDIDGRADVYSLACVSYECLTGAVPFPRDSPMAKLFAHLQEPAPNPSTINPALPANLDATLQQGLAKDPDGRYATATELVSDVAAALDTDPAPARVRPRRRTVFLLAAIALVVLGGLAAALVLTLGGRSAQPDPILPLTGDSAVRIDPVSNSVIAAVPVDSPTVMAEGDASLWVAEGGHALAQIDPERNERVRTVPLSAAEAPDAMAAGNGGAWLVFPKLSVGVPGRWVWKVDARTGVVTKLQRSVFPGDVAAVPGAIYVADPRVNGKLQRILPRPFTVAATLDVPADAIEYGPAGLWVLRSRDYAAEPTSTLARLDPGTGKVLARFTLAIGPHFGFAVGSNALWALDEQSNAVAEIDPATGAIEHTVQVGRIPTHIAAGAGAVWVTNSRDGTVTKIDPDTLDTRTIDVGGTPRGLAAGPEGVWVSVWPT